MRKPHYWKVAGASSAPSNILVFDCETHFGDVARCDGGEIQRLRLGVALAYRLDRGKRTRVVRRVFRTAEDFWALVESRLDRKRPLWVIGHNISYDLGCVNFWRWRTGSDYRTQKAAVSGSVFYLKGSWLGCPLNFCDTLNYFRIPLKKLGKSVGLAKLEMPEYIATDKEWENYCANDVEITALALDKLLAFNRQHALGPWQPTVAGLSFSAFRSCFMKHKVLVHNYKEILNLERNSYFGGIVDTPFVGPRISGPIYEMDVCSMYPACCRNLLPVGQPRDGRRYGTRALARIGQDRIVFADVEIDSPSAPYPVKLRRGTYYPTGRFRTVLAHPELMEAISLGIVKYVHHAAHYSAAPIFRGYMDWFVGRKIEYKRRGDEAFEFVAKMYATNLYGKTGQMTPKWQEWGEESLSILEDIEGLKPGTLAPWYGKPPDLYQPDELFRFPAIPRPIEVRDYFGVVELKVGDAESRDSCPCIAATVTSYARVLLRSYQRCAGVGNWFYSDTDSIWVNARGRENLERAGHVKADALGFLTEQKVHDWLIVHGPKDYETNLTVKLKGIKKNADRTDDGGYSQLQFPNALTQMRDGICQGVYVRHVTKHLRRKLSKCKVLTDGNTRPLVFPDENPERAREKRRERLES